MIKIKFKTKPTCYNIKVELDKMEFSEAAAHGVRKAIEDAIGSMLVSSKPPPLNNLEGFCIPINSNPFKY